jgi:hypothetical protein
MCENTGREKKGEHWKFRKGAVLCFVARFFVAAPPRYRLAPGNACSASTRPPQFFRYPHSCFVVIRVCLLDRREGWVIAL